MSATCNQCGDCCRGFFVHEQAADYKAGKDVEIDDKTRKWLDELILLTPTQMEERELPDYGAPRYDCPRFDMDTRLCTAHEDRPDICKGYPWYNALPDCQVELYANCSFAEDVADHDHTGQHCHIIPKLYDIQGEEARPYWIGKTPEEADAIYEEKMEAWRQSLLTSPS